MNILIADDHPALRSALAELLRDEPSVREVWEATGGEEAVTLVLQEHPDLVFMDVQMPDLDGIEATRRILLDWPDAKVIALTSSQDHEVVSSMLAAGAKGYLVKTSPAQELAQAVRAALEGRMVLSPDVVPGVLGDLLEHYNQARDRAESLAALARMQNEFVARVSDELRNPLTAIRGSTGLLRHDWQRMDDDIKLELLERIDRQADRLGRSIEQILTVAGIHRGLADPAPQRIALDAVCREALDRIGDRLDGREVELLLEPVDVVGDRAGLVAVALSLIENALVHATGPITIRVETRSDHAALFVEDEGPGVDAAALREQVARPFAAGDLSDTRQVGGLGLSLYIAGQVLDACGGWLEIDSVPGSGARFSAVLPRPQP